MPLPLGSWNLSANNSSATLTINSTASGGYAGIASFASVTFPIVGAFDETSQTFSFLLIDSSTSPTSYRSYTGRLYTASVITQSIGDFKGFTTTYVLAELFDDFPQSSTGPFNANAYSWLVTLVNFLLVPTARGGP